MGDGQIFMEVIKSLPKKEKIFNPTRRTRSFVYKGWLIRDETSLISYKPSLINQTACTASYQQTRSDKHVKRGNDVT